MGDAAREEQDMTQVLVLIMGGARVCVCGAASGFAVHHKCWKSAWCGEEGSEGKGNLVLFGLSSFFNDTSRARA